MVKKKLFIFIGIGAILAVLLAVLGIVIYRNRLTATSMKINELNGNVILSDSKGKEEPEEGRRLFDGNILDTLEDSSAVVLLDEERFVYLLERP